MNSSDPDNPHRIEQDMLGSVEVPQSAYWGVHTQRAISNFDVSSGPISGYPALIDAVASVKAAAAQANRDLGMLEPRICDAIVAACDQVRAGRWYDQFVVDSIQGGAGTSTNMNVNEVLANVALESLGHCRGSYDVVHPLDHVNMSQSTNDVYPTAARIACHRQGQRLVLEIGRLVRSLDVKAAEFKTIMKIGRTQLQDAVPMTLGEEFQGHATLVAAESRRVEAALQGLLSVNLGGTAIGTGLNAPPGFAERAVSYLRADTGLAIELAADLVAATPDVAPFVAVSSSLRGLALTLGKLCNDLRLLGSGPRAGLAELHLPPVQAGSSIMPGKVNPVIAELVNQIAFEVVGLDATVTMAASAGELQLNAFEPIIVRSLLTALAHLERGCETLGTRCIDGIGANMRTLEVDVQRSIGAATALNPILGYATASAVAREALATNRGVADVVLERGLLDVSALEELLGKATWTDRRSVHTHQQGLPDLIVSSPIDARSGSTLDEQ